MHNELEGLEVESISLVPKGAMEGAVVLLAKAERLPNPDLSGQPFKPVEPPPMALVDLRALVSERAALVGQASLGTELERRQRRARLVEVDELLRSGSARAAMEEQRRAQQRSLGVDEGVKVSTQPWDKPQRRDAGTRSGREYTGTGGAGGDKTAKAVTKADLGGMIRQARVEKRLTQSALAEAANVSVRTVTGWENGETAPSPLLSHRLACALDFDLDQRNAFAAMLRQARS